MYKTILLALIVLVFSSCSQGPSNTTSNNNIDTEDAWIREAPPNASMLAGYVTITNNSDQERILTSAKSKQFKMVEIHKTIVEDGVAKMRRQDDLAIPAGGSLVLEPGSYHLMLMHPTEQLKANDQVTVTVKLKSAEPANTEIDEIDIVMPVKKPNS